MTDLPSLYAAGLGTDATLTLSPGAPGSARAFRGVAFSYDTAPTAGRLTVQCNGRTLMGVSVTAAGAGFLPFAFKADTNSALVITLISGGAGVTGEITVFEVE